MHRLCRSGTVVSVNEPQCAAGANGSIMVSAAGARLLFLLISGESLGENFTKPFAAGRVCIFLNLGSQRCCTSEGYPSSPSFLIYSFRTAHERIMRILFSN